MNTKALKVLLIKDNLTNDNQIDEIFKDNQQLRIEQVTQMPEAIEILDSECFEAILFDLSVPDSQEADLNTIKQKAPQLPIVVITTIDDVNTAVHFLRQGVQDYLIKSQLEEETLIHSIHDAIDRKRHEFSIWQQASMKKMLDKIGNSIDLEIILQTTIKEIQQFLNTDEVSIYPCDQLAKVNISQFDAELNRLLSEQFMTAYLILPIWLKRFVVPLEKNSFCMVEHTAVDNPERELWGMLVAYNNAGRRWQDWEINFLQQLLERVAITISQSQLYRQLQIANKKLCQLAITDGLTKIANRRHFDLTLSREWYRLAREQQPLSLILCDIDYFKAYNDGYGHQQGDRCLQEIAEVLQQSIKRSADLAARYGGEEFAFILPNTNTSGALSIAQNIRERLARKRLPNKKSKVSKHITLSMGIATTIPHSRTRSNTIIAAADNLLYRAKKAGRDCIAVNDWEVCC